MKYVIFKRNNLFLPVMFPEHITHSQIGLSWDENVKLHSAGFYKIDRFGMPSVLPQKSSSLDVGPSDDDERLLKNFTMNMGTNSFIDYANI